MSSASHCVWRSISGGTRRLGDKLQGVDP
ncbi:MAG: hypothetical protein IPJ12_00510 [Betaproteobacteria bacterium]|nr:hypothetical protein [Betaproteobacteria bacterium]